MISFEKLEPIIAGYKAYFPIHWEDEKYKWEAIKHFQDHWNIDAENFGDMFKQATDKTFNLLASGYAYPRGMITNFAKADDEGTRAMFRALFDESVDLAARVDAFQAAAENMRAKYDDGTWRNHYQNTNAISTYLWLRYPDKYYIYKYELFKAAATELTADYMPKRNGSVDSLIGGFKMYDEICKVVASDESLKEMIQKALTPSCYPDPEMRTATIDVGFYLARFYLEERKSEQEEAEWFPKDYSPNLTVDDWVELLEDSSVFTQGSLQIMKRMKDYGGAATCKQLSVKYGENPNFYNGGSWSLAQRIAKKTGCPVMTKDTDNSKWWPILYRGRKSDKATDGAYIWKLRDELSEALDKVNLDDVELYAKDEETESANGYWWLTANPKIWSFADIKIGEEQSYNEGEASEFEQVVEKYRKRFGYYPERILADKIYRSKANRAFCKDHGIHLSGPRLGRPGKDHSEELLQELKEIGERNEVEGKFGNGKRKLGLSRIMAKLAETTGAMIGMDIFILNMEKLMRQEASLVCSFLGVVFSLALSIRKQHKNNVISGARAAV